MYYICIAIGSSEIPIFMDARFLPGCCVDAAGCAVQQHLGLLGASLCFGGVQSLGFKGIISPIMENQMQQNGHNMEPGIM